MKEITLDDLRVLVESLEDEETPTIQPEHKTLVDDGVREIQENVKTQDSAIEDFLRDEQCLNNNNENVVLETQTLNNEKSMDQFADEENFETVVLFSLVFF